MEKNRLFNAVFMERAAEAAEIYVSRLGKKTFRGLKNYISKNLVDCPISPEDKKEITNIITEGYRSKLKAI